MLHEFLVEIVKRIEENRREREKRVGRDGERELSGEHDGRQFICESMIPTYHWFIDIEEECWRELPKRGFDRFGLHARRKTPKYI